MPSVFCYNSNRQSISRIRAEIQILDEKILTLKIREKPLVEPLEIFFFNWSIRFTPINVNYGGRLFDEVLILRGSASMNAGSNNEWPTARCEPFTSVNSFLVERRGGQVDKKRPRSWDAEISCDPFFFRLNLFFPSQFRRDYFTFSEIAFAWVKRSR